MVLPRGNLCGLWIPSGLCLNLIWAFPNNCELSPYSTPPKSTVAVGLFLSVPTVLLFGHTIIGGCVSRDETIFTLFIDNCAGRSRLGQIVHNCNYPDKGPFVENVEKYFYLSDWVTAVHFIYYIQYYIYNIYTTYVRTEYIGTWGEFGEPHSVKTHLIRRHSTQKSRASMWKWMWKLC